MTGWTPKITFKALAEEMVDADMAELKEELAMRGVRAPNFTPP